MDVGPVIEKAILIGICIFGVLVVVGMILSKKE